MVTVTRTKSQGELAPCVRVGVGGRWKAEELQRSLRSYLASTGWQVSMRSAAAGQIDRDGGRYELRLEADAPLAGLVEIVPLGDGVSQVAGLSDSEELDAVVISPLDAETGTDGMTARRYLARFVRQLRPGGATIFAADDPASDIFAAIRLDCRRLGYSSGINPRNRRAERVESGAAGSVAWSDDQGTSLTDAPDVDFVEHRHIELAALAVVQAFGLLSNDSPAPLGLFVS